jgi:uncharacterized membrane protein
MILNNIFLGVEPNCKKFSIYLFSIQLMLVGFIGLDIQGLHFPIFRQLVGFIYLSLIPGILILKILKLDGMSHIESLLYSIGLSISSLMFVGFLVNFLSPFLSVPKPFSLFPLFIAISLFIGFLWMIYFFKKDTKIFNIKLTDLKELLSPSTLFLLCIPFLSIFGTYFVNFYDSNFFLMILIVIIAFIPLLVTFKELIPVKLYPLLLWVISISLIFHDTLISMYLNKFDVIGEYYFSSLVVNDSYWDWTINSNNNAMLSTTVLAPIFHIICGLDLTWVYKIIYPFLYSFVPLGLYSCFKNRFNEKVSFLSVYYIMCVNTFYCIVPSLCKQSIAEIFFVLLLLLLLNNKQLDIRIIILRVIFSFMLVVSHYGTSYLFLFSIIFTIILISLNEKFTSILHRKFWCGFVSIVSKNESKSKKSSTLNLNYVLLFIIFTLAWYIYSSNSSIFNSLIHISNHIKSTIFIEFMSPEHSRGMNSITDKPISALHFIGKIFNFVPPFFIIIGMFNQFFRKSNIKSDPVYSYFSIYWLIICFSAIAISGFAMMNPDRLYHLSLFLIAPFAVSGGTIFYKLLFNIFHLNNVKNSFTFLSVFFAMILLFSTGFVYEVANDHPSSISLSQDSRIPGDLESINGVIYLMHEQDVFSARWLSTKMDTNRSVYATKGNGEGISSLLAYGKIPDHKIEMLSNTSNLSKVNYIYVSYVNNVEKIGLGYNKELGAPTFFDMNDLRPQIMARNHIYHNGLSQITL